jgi:hypothetical protein
MKEYGNKGCSIRVLSMFLLVDHIWAYSLRYLVLVALVSNADNDLTATSNAAPVFLYRLSTLKRVGRDKHISVRTPRRDGYASDEAAVFLQRACQSHDKNVNRE